LTYDLLTNIAIILTFGLGYLLGIPIAFLLWFKVIEPAIEKFRESL